MDIVESSLPWHPAELTDLNHRLVAPLLEVPRYVFRREQPSLGPCVRRTVRGRSSGKPPYELALMEDFAERFPSTSGCVPISRELIDDDAVNIQLLDKRL